MRLEIAGKSGATFLESKLRSSQGRMSTSGKGEAEPSSGSQAPPTHPTVFWFSLPFVTGLGFGATYRRAPKASYRWIPLEDSEQPTGGPQRHPIGGYRWRVCTGTLGGPMSATGGLWVASSYGVWVLRTQSSQAPEGL